MNIYYQDEHVTLYHGDALEIDAWLEADVLVTDPPYGMSHQPRGSYNPATGITHKPKVADKVHGDKTTEVRDSVLAAWGDKPAMVFGTWRQPRPADVRHRLIWWKQGQPPGPARASFMLQDEEIYVLGKGWIETSPPMRTVIATNEHRSLEVTKIGHPTPKPLSLMEVLIDRAPNGVIADPFAGSGSTLVAARNLGRKAIGVELEEKYCEIIANRLSQQAFDFETIT